MINNFEYLKNNLEFGDANFFFIQVIQRRKDGNPISKDYRVIKSFYINSAEQLEASKPLIIELCKLFKARAYIYLTPRDRRHTALIMANECTNALLNSNFNMSNLWDGVCGKNPTKRSYLIDVDDSTLLEKAIKIARACTEQGHIMTIPTVQGMHIYLEQLNTRKFSQMLVMEGITEKQIEIKRNSPTLLYYAG